MRKLNRGLLYRRRWPLYLLLSTVILASTTFLFIPCIGVCAHAVAVHAPSWKAQGRESRKCVIFASQSACVPLFCEFPKTFVSSRFSRAVLGS